MKKLELKGMQMLTKEQMKKVGGGVQACYSCDYGGDIVVYCAANAEAAQSYCDGDCWSDDECDGCNCATWPMDDL